MTLPLPPRRVNRFVARFESLCVDCLMPIHAGDEAGYIEDDLCCDACCSEWEAWMRWNMRHICPGCGEDGRTGAHGVDQGYGGCV